MTKTNKDHKHNFHIPVMGLGYTIDSPLKVSQFGIDSVISIVSDILLEKMRKMYCEKFKIPYKEITDKMEDFRAKRVTSYLNLMNTLCEEKFKELKDATLEKGNDIMEYIHNLPNASLLLEDFNNLKSKSNNNIKEIGNWIHKNLSMGSIDVNIMTKLDKENFFKGEKLSSEFNDAHASLRGYAESNLSSTLVLSAGMNPRLYGYLENFEDFYPDESGYIKKKIALKVSDYRSALIQGKFLAKKGIWVSEYRVESGLNCGGHAFATEGFLMGPILNEFKENREELTKTIYDILVAALESKGRAIPNSILSLSVTAQGGVGTAEEHQFLIEEFEVDSVGWGSPFLMVPEATTVDEKTFDLLSKADEEDLYLSEISPLGVPFNSVRGNSKDLEKEQMVRKGRPGSSCPDGYLMSNREFTTESICTASRQYQRIKKKELDKKNLSSEEHQSELDKITVKSCLCVGLSASALSANNIAHKFSDKVSVCPGPNIAYFSKKVSLKEMIDHIYGRGIVMSRNDRPNMFIKELHLYMDYLNKKIDEVNYAMTKKQEKYLLNFSKNLNEGIDYYHQLFSELKDGFQDTKSNILHELNMNKSILENLHMEIENLMIPIPVSK